MVTTLDFLTSLLEITQLSQHILSRAMDAASSHGLKSLFRSQLLEYDRIESEIQIAAAQRGWEFMDLQPAARWISGFRFRRCLRRHRSDSSIAAYLIGQHTKDTVNSLKLHNQWDRSDEQILTIFQKLLDCKTIGIRQMQPYL